MKRIKDKIRRRKKRKLSIRKKISGTALKPRVTVFKSNKYCYIQVINDKKGETLAAASNFEKDNRNINSKVENIGKLGEIIAERMQQKKIKQAVFDRNGYKYHGVVKAIADGIRKAGINI
jgi:large subunit ribosomal protein L18